MARPSGRTSGRPTTREPRAPAQSAHDGDEHGRHGEHERHEQVRPRQHEQADGHDGGDDRQPPAERPAAQQQGRGEHARGVDRDHVARVDEDEGRQVHAVQEHQHEVHGDEHRGEHERATRHLACGGALREVPRQVAVATERRAQLREGGQVRVHHAEADDRRDDRHQRRPDAGHGRVHEVEERDDARTRPIAEHAHRHDLQGEVAGPDHDDRDAGGERDDAARVPELAGDVRSDLPAREGPDEEADRGADARPIRWAGTAGSSTPRPPGTSRRRRRRRWR